MEKFGQDTSKIHQEIRKNGLESFCMVTLQLKNEIKLDAVYTPLINKIAEHYYYESDLRYNINPFFTLQLNAYQKIAPSFLHDNRCRPRKVEDRGL